MAAWCQKAASMKIEVVSSVQAVSSPPMMPARHEGLSPSQTTPYQPSIAFVWPFRSVTLSPSRPQRTVIDFEVMRSRSKKCVGRPSSSMT